MTLAQCPSYGKLRWNFEVTMSKRSKNLRSMAASELRKSRKSGTSGGEKRNNRKRAAALKSLAESEERLGGEQVRSATRAKRR
jgi:hypothetical protein